MDQTWHREDRISREKREEEINYLLERTANSYIPRSLEESPQYSPEWRHQVAYRYLYDDNITQPSQEGLGCTGRFEENDALILNYFLYAGWGDCEPDLLGPIRWAHGAYTNNPLHGMGSKTKAWLLTDLPLEEMAKRLGTTKENVWMFQELFFDINRYRQNEHFMSGLCYPTVGQTSEAAWKVQERQWLGAAGMYGARGLDNILLRRPVDQKVLKDMEDEIRQMVVRGAYNHMMVVRTDPLPRPHLFEKYANMKNTEAIAKQLEQNNRNAAAMLAFIEGFKAPKPANQIGEIHDILPKKALPPARQEVEMPIIEAEVERIS